MSDTREAWDEVGSRFTGLGTKLRYHFEQVRSEGKEGAAAEEAGPEVKEALRKLADAIDDAFGAIGNAVKDQAVKEDVRQVGQSLASALSSTFNDISDELRKAFKRGGS